MPVRKSFWDKCKKAAYSRKQRHGLSHTVAEIAKALLAYRLLTMGRPCVGGPYYFEDICFPSFDIRKWHFGEEDFGCLSPDERAVVNALKMERPYLFDTRAYFE